MTRPVIEERGEKAMVRILGVLFALQSSLALGGELYCQPIEVAKLLSSSWTGQDRFGGSTDVSGDTAIVGANYDGSQSGSAFIYQRQSDGTWIETAKLTASDAADYDQFGHSVAIDGGYAIVGAPYHGLYDHGAAYVFERQAGGEWLEVALLQDADAANYDNFGRSVAISGDEVVVAAPYDDDLGQDAGKANVFKRSPEGVWAESAVLKADFDGVSWDNFGHSVAIAEDAIAIGAIGTDSAGDNTGSVYVFERIAGDVWGQATWLIADDAAAWDQFGWSVDVDGSALIIGSLNDDDLGTDSGSAYVFRRQEVGVWAYEAKLLASDGAGGYRFGQGVRLDSGMAAVSAPSASWAMGVTYVFVDEGDGAWSFDQQLVSEDAMSNDFAGLGLALDAGIVVVGVPADDERGNDAGAAVVYELQGAKGWSETATLLASDGTGATGAGGASAIFNNIAIVGAPSQWSGPGTATVFERGVEGDWSETAVLSDGTGEFGTLFGYAVTVSEETVIVGARGLDGHTGRSFVFDRDTDGDWVESQVLITSDASSGDRAGWSIASDADVAVIGAVFGDSGFSDAGSAYVFERNEVGVWAETAAVAADDGEYGDHFGESVAVSGGRIVVGSVYDDDLGNDSGGVYVFDRDLDGEWGQSAKLVASDGVDDQQFGTVVACFDDLVVVGAPGYGETQGAVYVFEYIVGFGWLEVAKLAATNGGGGDLFGCSIACDNNQIIVGDRLDDDTPWDAGAIYLFSRRTDGSWQIDSKQSASDAYEHDHFGWSLAMHSGSIVVGARFEDEAGMGAGAAYVLEWPELIDCNENGLCDSNDLVYGLSEDCNGNLIPDECEIADGTSEDCNFNGVPDLCELLDGELSDCDADGQPDECEDGFVDCNANGVADWCDIAEGTSVDCDSNGRPDECDISDATDCNGNGVLDSCDIVSGTSEDIDGNGIPDECPLPCSPLATRLTMPNGTEGFGFGVAVDDGRVAVRARQNSNGVTRLGFYDIGGFDPIKVIDIQDDFGLGYNPGWGNPIGMSGDWLALATYTSGAYLLVQANGGWMGPLHIGAPTDNGEPPHPYFGFSVAIDGQWLAVTGMQDGDVDGVVHVYQLAGGGWSHHQALSSDAIRFGASVAIEGQWMFVGAPYEPDGSVVGQVHVYRLQGDQWMPWQMLLPEMQTEGYAQNFGHRVVVHGGVVAVTTSDWGQSGENGGQVHVFGLAGDSWELRGAIDTPDGGDPEGFAHNVAIADGLLAVASERGSDGLGRIHLYELSVDGVPIHTGTIVAGVDNYRFYGNGLQFANSTLLVGGAYLNGDEGGVDVIRIPITPGEIDCNANGICDINDLVSGTSQDCDGGGIPDECEIASGVYEDVDGDQVPDVCEPNCDGDDWPDDYELAQGWEQDCNGNGVPDSCDVANGSSPDGDGDGIPDECDDSFIITVAADGGGLFSDLQSAINFAPPGSTILVYPGTYDGPFILPPYQVSLISAGEAGETQLTAGTSGVAVLLIEGNHDESTLVSGFTVADENCGMSSLVITGCSPHILECIFLNNIGWRGGAARVVDGGPHFERCVFDGNEADRGGGVEIFGQAADGTACRFNECRFSSNLASDESLYFGCGGAVACDQAYVSMTDCLLEWNTSAFTGGGLLARQTVLSITASEFYRNDSPSSGGAGTLISCEICESSISESTFCGNTPNDLAGYWEDLGGNWFGEDCNGNGICDADDLAADPSIDCDDDQQIDSCEIDSGQEPDCNENGIPDWCDIYVYETSFDFNDNGVPDECKADCNNNGYPDWIDIETGNSEDCNENGVPDECEDCNKNGIADECDIADGTSEDIDVDGVPDECQEDCDGDEIPDSYEIAQGMEPDCNANGVLDWCDINVFGTSGDCNANDVPDDCDLIWGDLSDCNQDGVIDECSPDWIDCNANGVLDSCDIDGGQSADCNANGIPDTCDISDGVSDDCNANDIPDLCEIADGSESDCNANGVLDSCELFDGSLEDCDADGVPDVCDLNYADCNDNGIADYCDIADEFSDDVNEDGIPDECDPDCNENGYPDFYDIAFGISEDGNGNGIPDECECADINGNGWVDVDDLLILLGLFGSCPDDPGCPGDVNWDGSVNVDDLLLLISAWGEPCQW